MTETNQRERCRLYVPDPESNPFDTEYTNCLNCGDWEMTHERSVVEAAEREMRRVYAAFWRMGR